MKLLRVSLLRLSRSSVAVLFVTLAVYVILTYKVSNDVTKHSGQRSTWELGKGNMTGNVRQQPFSTPSAKDSMRHSTGDNSAKATEDNKTNNVKGDNKGVLNNIVTVSTQVEDVQTKGSTAATQEETGGDPGLLGLDQLKPENLLLAGVPRKHRVELSIGLVTVSREKGDYFFDTLDSLVSRSSAEEQKELTIVVMLADRNQTHNTRVLTTLKSKYLRQLAEGVLLVIRGANTDFLFKDSKVKRTYNDSLDRVLWRSKQNLDYAAIIEFCTNLSTYYLHVEDDVIAAQMYVRHLREFIRANARTPWAMLELSPHGFIGKLFKNKDLPKLVMILRAFYLEQPCDFLIKPYFINIMTQRKPIVRKSPLFFHKGKFSSLKNVTRKIDKYSGGGVRRNADPVVKKVFKVIRNHKNPPATLCSDMAEYAGNHINGAYDPMKPSFFWASDVKAGQYVSILFLTPQRVERFVVETGFSDKDRKDILHKGSVEMGRDVPDVTRTSSCRCPNADKIGDFKRGDFDVTMKPKDDVRCINIVVDLTQKEWLIIRQILVFVTKT